MVRRTILAGTAVASLAAAATAWATAQQYNGPAGSTRGAGVEFNAVLSHGHPASVRRFEFHNIPAQCAGYGPTAVTEPLSITMRVNGQRRFKATTSVNGGRVTAKITGRFSRSFAKATGTLHVTGAVPGCASADTGVVTWSAPKVGPAG
jgi:hypothetical protein